MREQTGEDALGKASTADYHVVGLVHYQWISNIFKIIDFTINI